MIDHSQIQNEEMLISMVNPAKLIEHFGGDISEIKSWADASTKDELLISIKAFQKEGFTEYTDVLLESLNQK
jgi:hypothetical protein